MGSKQRISKYIKFGIYLLVIVLLNVAGLTLFVRFDLTKNGIYSLSGASKRVVKTLSEPLTIHIFFTKNLPAPYNNIERYLKDLLGEYAIHANRFFNYRFYSVSPDDEGAEGAAGEYQKLAGNYGIHPVQIQAVEEDEVKFKKAYMGLVLIHGDMIERLPTITTINGLEYDLTTAIMKLNNKISALLNLKEKVQIHLVISSSLKQVAPVMGIEPIADYPGKIKQIVAKLNEKMYGRLEYRFTDPSQEKEGRGEIEKYNLMRLRWPALTDRNIPAGSGEVGLVMTHGDRVREIPILNVVRIPIIGTQYNLVEPGSLEEMINDNLETLIDINEDLGYLADHGTPAVSPSAGGAREALSTFASLVSENYALKPVLLKDDSVLGGLRCLVIARPTEKFSDFDLFRIDQALMRGTNLAVFLDAFKQEAAQQQQFMGGPGPMLKPFDTGLEKLLKHYGVEIKSSIVMDKNCHRQLMPRQMGGGETPIYYVPIIKSESINQNLSFMKSIKGLIAIKMSPVVPDAERISANRIGAQMLFASSPESWEVTQEISLNPMFIRPPESDGELKSHPLGYLLEGSFPSYFAGKPIPERPAEKGEVEAGGTPGSGNAPEPAPGRSSPVPDIEGKGGFLEKSRNARILLIASSDMLSDAVLDPEGKSPNSIFILNALDALNDREDIAVMRSKEQRFNPLRETGPLARTLIKFFNVIGLPAIVVVSGLFLWWRRHARKKQIQTMFRQQESV